MIQATTTDGRLTDAEVASVCRRALGEWGVTGRRVLVLIPDHTRSCPLGVLFRGIYEAAGGVAARLDFMVALGTHPPLSRARICERLGITPEEHAERYSKAGLLNHCWDDPAALATVGRFERGEVSRITGGLFEMDVEVRVNRAVRDYDLLVIAGPVFPHEVVGFSGGNKYIFPGISGPEVLNFFHWLGAVITSPVIIGNKWTPVRKVIDAAAAMLPVERKAFCMVVEETGLAGLFAGPVEDAWAPAADLSAKLHVRTVDRAYGTVLACCPPMYDELWTAAKCMYKLEPAVRDGGRLIIHAPHLDEVSVVHGASIRRLGYHTRDYFLKQWARFKNEPWGVLAHSTHLKGIGTFENGVEKPRIEVVLASRIPKDECIAMNLGWADYREIDPGAYEGRDDVLVVRKAGEQLYRCKQS